MKHSGVSRMTAAYHHEVRKEVIKVLAKGHRTSPRERFHLERVCATCILAVDEDIDAFCVRVVGITFQPRRESR